MPVVAVATAKGLAARPLAEEVRHRARETAATKTWSPPLKDPKPTPVVSRCPQVTVPPMRASSKLSRRARVAKSRPQTPIIRAPIPSWFKAHALPAQPCRVAAVIRALTFPTLPILQARLFTTNVAKPVEARKRAVAMVPCSRMKAVVVIHSSPTSTNIPPAALAPRPVPTG